MATTVIRSLISNKSNQLKLLLSSQINQTLSRAILQNIQYLNINKLCYHNKYFSQYLILRFLPFWTKRTVAALGQEAEQEVEEALRYLEEEEEVALKEAPRGLPEHGSKKLR